MATCSASTLLAAGPCFCKVTADSFVLARLTLLCEILQTLDPMASCDVEQLMEDGRCFCPVTMNPAEIVELQLLCEIKAASTGGGGGGAVQVYDTYPAAPDDTSKAALSYPSGGGTLYQWDTISQAWV